MRKRVLALLAAVILLWAQPASAAIALVNRADLGLNGGSGTSFSASYTVGSGATRLLVVTIWSGDAGSADNITGGSATYNGVAMTLARVSSGTRWIGQYYLLNPASGSNTVAVTTTRSDYIGLLASDYTGVLQSSQPDATGASSASNDTTLTVGTANSWTVLSAVANGSVAASTNSTGVTAATFGNAGHFDSNGAVAAGSFTMSFTSGDTSKNAGVIVSYKPDTGGGGGAPGCKNGLLMQGAGCEVHP